MNLVKKVLTSLLVLTLTIIPIGTVNSQEGDESKVGNSSISIEEIHLTMNLY